jgi:hypothetical protein
VSVQLTRCLQCRRLLYKLVLQYLAQPLTEMSTGNLSWGGKGGRCVGLTTLPPSCADCLKTWEPRPPGALRALLGLYGTALPLPFTVSYSKHKLCFLDSLVCTISVHSPSSLYPQQMSRFTLCVTLISLWYGDSRSQPAELWLLRAVLSIPRVTNMHWWNDNWQWKSKIQCGRILCESELVQFKNVKDVSLCAQNLK